MAMSLWKAIMGLLGKSSPAKSIRSDAAGKILKKSKRHKRLDLIHKRTQEAKSNVRPTGTPLKMKKTPAQNRATKERIINELREE